MTSIPTKEDFGDITQLDVKYAWRMFGGKNLDEAYEVFRENAFSRQEDLTWMGTRAFIYYFPVAVRYLTSPESEGDSDAASSIMHLLEFRLEHDLASIQPLSAEIVGLCDYVAAHYPKYDITESIYGPVKARYEKIKEQCFYFLNCLRFNA